MSGDGIKGFLYGTVCMLTIINVGIVVVVVVVAGGGDLLLQVMS